MDYLSKRTTKHFTRYRLISPTKFTKASFRTIKVNPRTEIVIGKLKGHKKTTAQAIMVRR